MSVPLKKKKKKRPGESKLFKKDPYSCDDQLDPKRAVVIGSQYQAVKLPLSKWVKNKDLLSLIKKDVIRFNEIRQHAYAILILHCYYLLNEYEAPSGGVDSIGRARLPPITDEDFLRRYFIWGCKEGPEKKRKMKEKGFNSLKDWDAWDEICVETLKTVAERYRKDYFEKTGNELPSKALMTQQIKFGSRRMVTEITVMTKEHFRKKLRKFLKLTRPDTWEKDYKCQSEEIYTNMKIKDMIEALHHMNEVIESMPEDTKGRKFFNILPFPRSFIPSSITVDTEVLEKSWKREMGIVGDLPETLPLWVIKPEGTEKDEIDLQDGKKKPWKCVKGKRKRKEKTEKDKANDRQKLELWATCFHLGRLRTNWIQRFHYLIQTDGISVSLLFYRKHKSNPTICSRDIFAKDDLSDITNTVEPLSNSKSLSSKPKRSPGRSAKRRKVNDGSSKDVEDTVSGNKSFVRPTPSVPLPHGIPIVGIDPGMTNLLYCINNDGSVKFRYSSKERKRRTRYTKFVDKDKKDETMRSRESKSPNLMEEALSAMSRMSKFPHNVPTTEGFMGYLYARWEATPALSEWYKKDSHREDRFMRYSRKQREDDRIKSKLIEKLGIPDPSGIKKTVEERVAIAYGSWGEKYSGGLKNSPSTPNKHILKLVQSCFKHIFIVDENYTSQTCNHCGHKAIGVKAKVDDKDVAIRRGLFRCTNENCRRFLSRDRNGATNIQKLGETMRKDPENITKSFISLKKPIEGSKSKPTIVRHKTKTRVSISKNIA